MKKNHSKHKQTANPELAPGMTEEPLQAEATPDEIRRGEYTRVVRLEEKNPRY